MGNTLADDTTHFFHGDHRRPLANECGISLPMDNCPQESFQQRKHKEWRGQVQGSLSSQSCLATWPRSFNFPSPQTGSWGFPTLREYGQLAPHCSPQEAQEAPSDGATWHFRSQGSVLCYPKWTKTFSISYKCHSLVFWKPKKIHYISSRLEGTSTIWKIISTETPLGSTDLYLCGKQAGSQRERML